MAKPKRPKPEPVAPAGSDTFSREVDEELRQEYLKQLWDRFGLYIILAAILIVVITGGYRGWTYYQRQAAITAGDAFLEALEAGSEERTEEALEAFQAIAEGGHGGYAALAQFRIAAAHAESGEVDEAVSRFDRLAQEAQDESLRALAHLRAGLLLIDRGEADEVKNRLQVLANPDSLWRHSAREYIALAAYKADDHETATTMVNLILEDSEAPSSIRSRAQILKTQIEAPGAGEASTSPRAAPDTEPGADTGAE